MVASLADGMAVVMAVSLVAEMIAWEFSSLSSSFAAAVVVASKHRASKHNSLAK